MTRKPADWLRAVEAAAGLLAMRVGVAVLPLRVVATILRLTLVPPLLPLPSGDEPGVGRESCCSQARLVGQAIERAARWLPVHTRCLHQALAGVLMLRWRRLPALVVFGVCKRNEMLRAHAWLLSGVTPVVGWREQAGFTPLAGMKT